MANIVKTFWREALLFACGVAAALLGAVGLISVPFAITLAIGFGFASVILTMYNFLIQAVVNKNPFFLKESKDISLTIYYRMLGKDYVPVGYSNAVEYNGSLGYDRKYGYTIAIDEVSIEKIGNKRYLRALLVGDKTAITIPHVLVRKGKKVYEAIPELDEVDLHKKVEKTIENLKTAFTSSLTMISQNVQPFTQFVVSGGIVGVALTLSIIILVLSWNFAKDQVEKATNVLKDIREPMQTNKILAESLKVCQLQSLGLLNETNITTKKSSKEEILKILTGGG